MTCNASCYCKKRTLAASGAAPGESVECPRAAETGQTDIRTPDRCITLTDAASVTTWSSDSSRFSVISSRYVAQ